MLKVETITAGGCGHLCLECGFLMREGTVKELKRRGGERKCLFLESLFFSPLYFLPSPLLPTTSVGATCSLSPLVNLPSSFTHIHLTNLIQELRSDWRKCLHPLTAPHALFMILCDIFWPGLSSSPSTAEVFHLHLFSSDVTTCCFLCSHMTKKPAWL